MAEMQGVNFAAHICWWCALIHTKIRSLQIFSGFWRQDADQLGFDEDFRSFLCRSDIFAPERVDVQGTSRCNLYIH